MSPACYSKPGWKSRISCNLRKGPGEPEYAALAHKMSEILLKFSLTGEVDLDAEGLHMQAHPAPLPQSVLGMIGGRLSRNECGVSIQRIGLCKGNSDIPLAEVFSEYPVARHFVCSG
jgi:hypothetical protein